LVISNKKLIAFLNNSNSTYTFDKKILKNSSNEVSNKDRSLRVVDNLSFGYINKTLNSVPTSIKCAFDMYIVNKDPNSIINSQLGLYNKSSNY
jgi:hypothetical protein